MSTVVKLNHRGDPRYRDVLYVEPLEDILRRVDAGSVSGSGTMLDDVGEPIGFEIDIEPAGERGPEAGEILVYLLDELNAPYGSSVINTDTGEELPAGVVEGLAVYVDGAGLPRSTYRRYGLDNVIDEANTLAETLGSVRGSWTGPTESAVYIYGSSARDLQVAIQPMLDQHPLCVGARVVIIAHRPESHR